MAKQLNIFLENRPGRLGSIAKVLTDKKISIIAFTIQDRGDFGLMEILVDKPQEAYLSLADKGYACALKDVMIVSVKDKSGNLYKLSQLFFKNKINIRQAHGYVMAKEKQGICCLDVNLKDEKKIRTILKKANFRILEEKNFYELL